MAYTLSYGGSVNSTSGHTSYPNNYVYTDGYTFPTGSLDSTGNRPVRVYDVNSDYASGASGIYSRITYRGVDTGGGYTFTASGGTFRHKIGYSSGQLYFGRNTSSGTVHDAADGGTWGGQLVGSFTWATAPAAPTMLSATPGPAGSVTVKFSGNSNGGSSITGWVLQYSTSSNFSGATTVASNGTTTLNLTPGKLYYFRAAGRNDVVDSLGRYGAWSSSISATMRSGGKVSVSGVWKPGVTKVSVSGAWHDAIVRTSVSGVWKDAL